VYYVAQVVFGHPFLGYFHQVLSHFPSPYATCFLALFQSQSIHSAFLVMKLLASKSWYHMPRTYVKSISISGRRRYQQPLSPPNLLCPLDDGLILVEGVAILYGYSPQGKPESDINVEEVLHNQNRWTSWRGIYLLL
jgi:hypothetical protein